MLQSVALKNLYFGPFQDWLELFEPVLPAELRSDEQVEPVESLVVAPAMVAVPVLAVPANISKFSRLLLPAVLDENPITQIRVRSVAPGSVEPARI